MQENKHYRSYNNGNGGNTRMLELQPYYPQPQLSSQADNDTQVIAMWLHGRSKNTQRAYKRDAFEFLSYVEKEIQRITIGDVQDFADSILHLSERTQGRKLSSVKSLLSFAHRIGYAQYNVGAPVQLPKPKDTIAERILSEEQVLNMISSEKNQRNKVILRLLYSSGIRVSEIVGLRWKDTQERQEAGQITVYGKGSKTRTILLSEATWKKLIALHVEAGPDDPIFKSRKHGDPISQVQVWRIVRTAAKRAGIDKNVSPHWMRHAHVSHALDRGCPTHQVQATVGHSSLATTSRYCHVRPTDSSSRYLAV